MSRAAIVGAALVAVSLNADAADNPGAPDFVVDEYAPDGKLVETHHYHPLADSPVLVPIDGWNCSATGPKASKPMALWVCLPNGATVSAAVKCRAGGHTSMALTPPDDGHPTKVFALSIDWKSASH